jgi:hypothetical protein
VSKRQDKYEGLRESLEKLPDYALRRLASIEERSAEPVPIYREELEKRSSRPSGAEG